MFSVPGKPFATGSPRTPTISSWIAPRRRFPGPSGWCWNRRKPRRSTSTTTPSRFSMCSAAPARCTSGPTRLSGFGSRWGTWCACRSEPKDAPPLHVHDDTEQIFYVLSGAGTLYIGADAPQRFRVKVGDLVRIPPHTFHRDRKSGKEKLVYLSVDCFPGGRPKDEPTWESHVRVMCALNGWDFDKVRK